MSQREPIEIIDTTVNSGTSMSPFTWQQKYALAHKGLDHKVITGGFTTIKERSGGRTDHNPCIRDGETWVFESLRGGDFVIADYLDKTYPELPALFQGQVHHNSVKFCDTWMWLAIVRPWFDCYILDYHDACLPEDRAYVRQSREQVQLGGKTMEEVQAGREDRLPGVSMALEPLREVLSGQRWLGGDAPDFADYAPLSIFLWAASLVGTPPLADNDPLRDWIERGFDLFGGLGRHPGLKPLFGLDRREGDPPLFVGG
ncbi:glutathione S-transferase family protein [Aurantiacibacter flavus]|uniref:Glutathione S-transferase family protein n=1 Tax=Aurantiacibacter flavus TaxID=3145232 RepID=A0ABV0D112_9SPHN